MRPVEEEAIEAAAEAATETEVQTTLCAADEAEEEEEEGAQKAPPRFSCRFCFKPYIYAASLATHEAKCPQHSEPNPEGCPALASTPSSSGASKPKGALAVLATTVLEATAVGEETRVSELLATKESLVTAARQKRKFDLWTQISEGVSEDDDAEQARLMKAARQQAECELPFDADTVELRAAYDRVQAARNELLESEGALAAVVGRLDGTTPSAKHARKSKSGN